MNAKNQYLEKLADSAEDIDEQIAQANEELKSLKNRPAQKKITSEVDLRRKQQELDDAMRTLEILKDTIDRKDKEIELKRSHIAKQGETMGDYEMSIARIKEETEFVNVSIQFQNRAQETRTNKIDTLKKIYERASELVI